MTGSTSQPPISNSTISTNINATVHECARFHSWEVALAAGIPICVVLALAIVLAVVCIRQRRSSHRGEHVNPHLPVSEESNYDRTLPVPQAVPYSTMIGQQTHVYVNENHKTSVFPKPMQPPHMGKANQHTDPTGQKPSAIDMESIYETCSPVSQ
ncbi:hypothetical protein Y1Q_0001968 [Alligator mississippiensis]|uniref:Uncharacterized protein n=1 Tax=Alligator mississippiensis TaxID=8496 RepID=A0A151PGL1_ALLMI|nr:hypothetical protein Y1Q_0001968 [Alligator mississippiensis]